MPDFETPHPKNVPGPFYVLDGCCTRCGVPEAHAPLHFGFDDQDHCFICRQPADDGEVEDVIDAAVCAELECIRYRGNDVEVLHRLAERGHEHLADVPLPAEVVRRSVTDRVRFKLREVEAPTALQAAEAFRSRLLERERAYQEAVGSPFHRIGEAEGGRLEATLAYGRRDEKVDVVEFRLLDDATGEILARHHSASRPSGRRVGRELMDWLLGAAELRGMDWFSEARWEEGGPPCHWPPQW